MKTLVWIAVSVYVLVAQSSHGQAVKILPVGDSWTEGVGHHVSYRYDLWFKLTEARVMIEKWRCRYNERRPHSSQNYITPAMAYFGLREMRKI